MKESKGITLLALIITIIVILILGGVVINQLNNGGIIENTKNIAEQAKIENKKEEIELAITNKMITNTREITIEQIIEELEKEGIINKGNSNKYNGQVKTNPDGYIYEIKEDENGNWEVKYIGKGEIEKTEIKIEIQKSTQILTSKLTLTITAQANSGIEKYTDASGKIKTYTEKPTKIEETYEITKNGIYTFTVENQEGNKESKNIEINNILEGTIAINAKPDGYTNQDVTVTITWPKGSEQGTKEIKIGEGNWQEYKEETSQITIKENCTIKARITNEEGEITSANLKIANIDKTTPTVTAIKTEETIIEGDSKEISSYFEINVGKTEAEGGAPVTIKYTTNGNEISNTNTLTEGTYTITCTVTKATGAKANATITIKVEEKIKEITATEVAKDASYIGKYVNYTVPTGGDPNVKWRIFYADGMNGETVAENDRHIYLISDDYLKYDYVPTKTVNGTTYTMYKRSDYKLSFDNMYKAYSSNTCSTNITDTRIKKWMQYVDKYPNSKNENISSIAYMLDTGIWNTKYKNSYADYAIGGPTIELFNASYKATHPNKYIEATVSDSNGYKVKWSTDSSYSDYIYGLNTSELNNLYVRDNTNASAMWLASPSVNGNRLLLLVDYDGRVDRNYYDGTYSDYCPGLRAVVCLSSNVQLVQNGDAYDLITIK